MTKLASPIAFRFIPKGAVKIADKKSDAIAYLYSFSRRERSQLGVVIYFGNQSKPVAHFTMANPKSREATIVDYFGRRQAHCDYRARQAASRKNWVNDYKVGEIVNTNWGYEQTNVEFFEIVAVRGKKVTIREIAATSYDVGEMTMTSKVAPLPGDYIGAPMDKLATVQGIKTGRHAHTLATRTAFTETVPGLKVYGASHVSSYA